MKNYLILLVFAIIIASCSSPQREITNNIEQGEFEEAFRKLNLLFEEEGAKNDPEIWLLKVDIYMAYGHARMVQAHDVEDVREIEEEDYEEVEFDEELIDEPFTKAIEAIEKAEELDESNIYMLEIQQKRLILSELVFNEGLIYFENENFADASKLFYKSYDISKHFETVDTMTLYNAALAANQAGLTVKAQEYYKTLVELELEEPYIYAGLSNTYLKQREEFTSEIEKNNAFIKAFERRSRVDSIFDQIDIEMELKAALSNELDAFPEVIEAVIEEKPHRFSKEEIDEIRSVNEELSGRRTKLENDALAVIKDGREKFPDNIDLIFSEANFYLLTGKTQEAREILDLAIEREPDNASLYFAFGANYEEMMGDDLLSEDEREMAFEEAVNAYEKAIELDDSYADAYYNLGALYFNKGIQIFEEADEELRETRDFQQYREAEKEVDEMWLKAQPYMEKARELIDPSHHRYRAVITSLLQLYARTDQDEKQEEIQEEYQELIGEPQDN